MYAGVGDLAPGMHLLPNRHGTLGTEAIPTLGREHPSTRQIVQKPQGLAEGLAPEPSPVSDGIRVYGKPGGDVAVLLFLRPGPLPTVSLQNSRLSAKRMARGPSL